MSKKRYKRLEELTVEETEEAIELMKDIILLFKNKQVEPLIALRAIEMLSSQLLHTAQEIEGRSLVENFVTKVRELHEDIK